MREDAGLVFGIWLGMTLGIGLAWCAWERWWASK